MSRDQRGTLAAAGLGFVIVLLDVSVVNVALDALRGHFATDVTGLQWVVNAYTLAFASLLLTTGALGDRFGAKRIFAAGFAVFTLASIGCGIADSLQLLVAARVVQGIGARAAGAQFTGHAAPGVPGHAAKKPRCGLVGRCGRNCACRWTGFGRPPGNARGLAQHLPD